MYLADCCAAAATVLASSSRLALFAACLLSLLIANAFCVNFRQILKAQQQQQQAQACLCMSLLVLLRAAAAAATLFYFSFYFLSFFSFFFLFVYFACILCHCFFTVSSLCLISNISFSLFRSSSSPFLSQNICLNLVFIYYMRIYCYYTVASAA